MKKALFVLLVSVFAGLTQAASVDTLHIVDPETWSIQELRNYIGRTVVFDCPIYVCNNYNSPITVSTRRIFSGTNQAYPRTIEYSNIMTLNNNAAMRLSGVSGYHRDGERIFGLKAKVNAVNSLDWIDGEWRGNTRADMEKMAQDRFPELGDYRLLVCTANLEYYLTVPNTDPTSTMGPSSSAEHQEQRKKVSQGLAAIGADIYGLVEIEAGDSALAELARDLSKNTGRPYTYISGGDGINGTFTKAGFIYCTETVTPVGKMQENGTVTNHRSQMQCFRELSTGETFLLSENHFKAKSGSGSGLNADQGDGQGQYNYKRVEEAKSVITQYKRFRTQIKEKDILVMGDLNAYAKEDPITTFTNGEGWYDLHRYFHADTSYSYTFAGQAGYLDHAICNPTLLKQVTGMTGFHVNSDESDDYTYDGRKNDGSMFRYSDHDPVVVGLRLDGSLSVEPELAVSTLVTEEEGAIVVSNAKYENQHSYYTLHTIEGWLVERGEIKEQIAHIERPTAVGVYILRVFANGQVQQKKIIVL